MRHLWPSWRCIPRTSQEFLGTGKTKKPNLETDKEQLFNSNMKMCSTSSDARECKLKPPWDPATRPPGWRWWNRQTASSVGKDGGTAGVLLTAGGDRNGWDSGKLAGSATARMQQFLCWVDTLRKHTECPQPRHSLTRNSPNLHPHRDRSINYDLSLRRSTKEQHFKMNYCYTQ